MKHFSYDTDRRRYVNEKTGRTISDRQMRGLVADVTEAAQRRAQQIAESYNAGRISQPEFAIKLAEEIKQGERAIATLAYGGYEQMTASRWGRTGAYTRSQQQYLIGFSADIARGAASPAEIVSRAGMYQESLAASYQNHFRAREQQAGVERVTRHLDDGADHCDGCLEAAGDHAIDAVPAIGDQQCGARCRCWLESVVESVQAVEDAA